MNREIFEVLAPGLGATLQDRGRFGWRKFGVPPSGAMDDHAAAWANRLLDNAQGTTVIELLLQGARLAVRQDVWIAITGADAEASVPTWRAVRVRQGQVVCFPQIRRGVWIYLAVEGGFAANPWLASRSGYPRGQIARPLPPRGSFRRDPASAFQLPT